MSGAEKLSFLSGCVARLPGCGTENGADYAVQHAARRGQEDYVIEDIELPKGWKLRPDTQFGVVITAPHGSVTIDITMRNFVLGERMVMSYGKYSRRGWRKRLFQDAIQALEKAKK
ncbi:hypothetical protein [Ralstonia sp. 121560039-2]|jgi:hypothetical protein